LASNKIVFVNRFYWPDFSATSQMLTDLATGLAGDYEVTVVTSRALYNDPIAKLERREVHAGVEVLRLNTTRRGRAKLSGRTLDYASFYIRVFIYLLRYTRKGDLVVLKTDPPLMSLMNTLAVRLRGGRVVNWLQDVFPEIAIELGVFPRNRALSSPLKGWRNRSLRAAAVNVTISGQMQKMLARQGVDNTRVIPNWADGALIRPLAHADNPLRAEWNPENKFLVGYSGNFGRAHCFDELLEAMTLLKVRPEIHFVLIGEGAALDSLLEAVERRGLENVSFQPYQPHDTLRQSLGAIDLHLVTLKEGMEGLVLPSKIYGVMAAGRPIAFIGETDGEIAGLIRGHAVGFVVGHGHGAELAEQIQRLSRESERLRQMGENARDAFDDLYSKPCAIERWKGLLGEIEGGRVDHRDHR
jgi:glycosyltransferase involved in cell wall biosynthesis